MSRPIKKRMRCAVYTRKSSEEGLDQDFNSTDAQWDAGHAYIASQHAEGWIAVADDYDDPTCSGGNMERPALRRLMVDIEAGRVKVTRGKIRVSVEGRLISRPANNTPP